MKDINHYLSLPYTIVVRRDEQGDFVAKVDELPGCSAHGATKQDALGNLDEAMRLWLEDSIESGDPIPEPSIEETLPSGKWLQRVPRSLHRKLIQRARRENVSLNQMVTSMLSEAIGLRKGGEEQGIAHAFARQIVDMWHVQTQDLSRTPLEWSIREHRPSPLRASNAFRFLRCRPGKRKIDKIQFVRLSDEKETIHQDR